MRWRLLRLFATVAAIWATFGPAAAQATTTVNGVQDTNAPLEIVPNGSFTDQAVSITNGNLVAFIQRMPVTKTIERVTLGDLACSSGSNPMLFIREHPQGRLDTETSPASWQADALDWPELPRTPGRVTWNIERTRLHAGKGYSIWIQGTCDSGMTVRTWPHNQAQVNAGPARCDRVNGGHWRMWHQSGQSDAVRCPASAPTRPDNFAASMPTGWLSVQYYGPGSVIEKVSEWTQTEPPGNCFYDDSGAERVFWRVTPGSPTWKDWVCRWTQFPAFGDPDPVDGWQYAHGWMPAPGPPRDVYMRLDTIDYNALLERYVPQLRYHYAESFRADSAWTATLPLPPFSGDPERSNNLERENGSILTSADPLLGYPPLSLDALPARLPNGAELYPSGEPPLDSDRVDFRNDTYQDDAAAMHANSGLSNRIYARAVQAPDGKLWLQYWLFYYYNQGTLGFGDHEADWEMIQVGLKSDLTPDVATYAQHSDAQSCAWARVPKYNGPSGVGPVAFVELGSHASLFYAAEALSYDVDHGSERVRPAVERQIGNAEPSWANWRGRWGGSDATIRSPGEQGSKWNDPTGFNAAARQCPTEASGAVTARRGAARPRLSGLRKPPTPGLRATRSGRSVLIRYEYSPRQWKRLARKAGLVLAVRGSKKATLPRSKIVRVRHRAGRYRLRFPLSSGPYVVQGQTLVPGAQGRPVTIRLR